VSGRWGPSLIVASVTAAALYALFAGGSTPPPLGRGAAAPAFELPGLDGGSLALSQMDGKVVLVNFWATWCKPCEDEMPSMEKLYRELHGTDFELVAISVDGDRATVAEFRDKLGLTFPILLDPEQDAAAAYQTFRFPESFLIGRDGIVVERYVGPKEWAAPAYVARVRRLLEAGPPEG
jgi:peroxiredoxin